MTTKYSSHTIVAACFMIQAVGVGTFVTYGVFLIPLPKNSGGQELLFPGHLHWRLY